MASTLLGLDMSLNPFTFHPGYQALAHLPLAERLAQLRRDDVRERILSEQASTQGPANQRALRRCRCGALLCCALALPCSAGSARIEAAIIHLGPDVLVFHQLRQISQDLNRRRIASDDFACVRRRTTAPPQ